MGKDVQARRHNVGFEVPSQERKVCLWLNAVKIPFSFPLATNVLSVLCLYLCSLQICCQCGFSGCLERAPAEGVTGAADPESLRKDCLVIAPYVQPQGRMWHLADAQCLPLRTVVFTHMFSFGHIYKCEVAMSCIVMQQSLRTS